MPRADLLKRLFTFYVNHDDDGFRRIAEELVREARDSGHHLVAEDLRTILAKRNGSVPKPPPRPSFAPLTPPPKSDPDASSIIEIREPRHSLEDLVLDENAAARLERIVMELRCQQRLAEFNLAPARKLLFHGPPGCGKTLTAEVLARELGLPFALARIDAVVSSFLGETSANLRRVIDFAERTPCVLLLDEFDSIGKSRDDPHEVGELKRVINSFLQMLDGFAGMGVIVAATDHSALLDPALWRRFDDVILFPRPTPAYIVQLLSQLTRGIHSSDISPSKLAKSFAGLSHSEVTDVIRSTLKHMVLTNHEKIGDAEVLAELRRYRGRIQNGASSPVVRDCCKRKKD